MGDAIAMRPTADRVGTVTVALCCLVTLIEGFDLQAAGVIASRLVAAFGIPPERLGLFFSVGTFGLLIGAACGGRLSDRIGRKTTLLAAIATFGLMSILTGLAGSFEMLVTARFLTGLGLGGALPNLLALTADNTPVRHRGSAIAILYAGMPLGGAMTSLVLLASGDPADWSTIFILGGLAPLVVIPALWAWLPDSRAITPRSAAPVAPAAALFGGGRAGATLILWIGFFLGLLVLYLLLNWLPSMLIARGLTPKEAAVVQLAFNVAGAVGSVAAGLLIDRLNRTAATAIIFGLGLAALLFLNAVPSDFPAVLLAGLCIGLTITGTQTVFYGLAPSCYPAEIRGTGIGAAVSVGRMGAVAGPFLAGALLGGGRAGGQILLLLVPVLALSGLAAMVLSRFGRAP